jgi:hypothetical protein
MRGETEREREREREISMRREPETHRHWEREGDREMRRTWFFFKDSVSCISLGFLLRLGVLLIAFVCVVFQL